MALVSRRRIKLRPFPIQRGVDVGHVRASIGHHVMPVADKKSSAFPWVGDPPRFVVNGLFGH